MSKPPFEVVIRGMRGREWQDATGLVKFPVLSPFPVRATLPGFTEATDVYLVATHRLPIRTIAAIARHLAGKFGVESAEVIADIHRIGLPILAEDCIVLIHDPSVFA